jgi:hypothetical protein
MHGGWNAPCGSCVRSALLCERLTCVFVSSVCMHWGMATVVGVCLVGVCQVFELQCN